jgi:hypothetical protein
MEIITMTVAESTMVGPVGMCAAVPLSSVPLTPATAPNAAASTTITPSELVHCRAAAAGAMTMALISTTPTVWSPMTMAMTRNVVSRTSMVRMGMPWDAPYSGSKLSSLNSFQNTATASSAAEPRPAITATSRSIIVAACPNRNVSSPACDAVGVRCTNVSSTSPTPKKTERTMPSALSSGRRLCRTIIMITRVPSQPASAAPSTSTSVLRVPVSMNASTMPGSAAWEMASPSRLCRRSTAKRTQRSRDDAQRRGAQRDGAQRVVEEQVPGDP